MTTRMKRKIIIVAGVLCAITSPVFAALGASAVARNITSGVNVVGVQNLSEPQQDALVAILQKQRVGTVRTGLGDKSNQRARIAHKARLAPEIRVWTGAEMEEISR